MTVLRILAFTLLFGFVANGVLLSDGVLLGDGVVSGDGAGLDPHGGRTNAGVRIDPEG
jgi:hypothetical protein